MGLARASRGPGAQRSPLCGSGRQPVGGLASAAGKVLLCQTTVHAAPLSVNDVGFAVLPVCVAWNPMLTDAPGAMPGL